MTSLLAAVYKEAALAASLFSGYSRHVVAKLQKGKAMKKTVWLLAVLVISSVKFTEAQQPTKKANSVKLNWEDTSDNEKGFRIYRITPKGKTKIAEVRANITTYTDKNPASRSCYMVTAFNSAGESDPTNVSCVGDATKGRLCEIELSPNGLKLLSEIEQTFNKQVRDQWSKDMDRDAAGLITPDGTPTIKCGQAQDLNEEMIVHELSHLGLRAAGFPTLEFTGIEPNISQWIDENLYDTIQHWIMYPRLRKLGYTPDGAKKTNVKRVISENKFPDEPIPPSDIISRYVRVALESSDPLLPDQFGEWYMRRGWDKHLRKAQNLVQFMKRTNPATPEQAIQAVIELANAVLEPYLTFQVERWEAESLGSVVNRKVIIRALPQSPK